MKKYPAVIAGITVCAAMFLTLTAKGTPHSAVSLMQQIQSEKAEEREAAVRGIVAQREEAIKAAEATIRQFITVEDRKKIVETSILLLGKIQAQKSVPLLVENLTYNTYERKEVAVFLTVSIEERFPCVQALIDIGLPSLDPLVERVKNDDDEDVVLYSWRVIDIVLGRDAAFEYLEQKMSRENDEVKKTRLSRLMAWVERSRKSGGG